jgi:hypothetical protein
MNYLSKIAKDLTTYKTPKKVVDRIKKETIKLIYINPSYEQ